MDTWEELRSALAEGGDVVIRASLGLRLRSAPSLDAAPLASLPDGARLTVTGDSRLGLVEGTSNGHRGWVPAEYLTVPNGAIAAGTVTTVHRPGGVPLRTGPTIEDSAIGPDVLPEGVAFTLTGERRLGFVAATHDGKQGWIYSEYLVPAPPGRNEDTVENLSGCLSEAPGWEALNVHNTEIARAAAAKGVPANLIKSMINRESSGNWERDGARLADVGRVKEDGSPNHILPFVGIFETTAASWGYDFSQMIGNKYLQIEAMATIVKGLAEEYGGYENAATVYFGGPKALTEVFIDEFGMRSDVYAGRAIKDWRDLDGFGC